MFVSNDESLATTLIGIGTMEHQQLYLALHLAHQMSINGINAYTIECDFSGLYTIEKLYSRKNRSHRAIDLGFLIQVKEGHMVYIKIKLVIE
jgi:hypothetical protein